MTQIAVAISTYTQKGDSAGTSPFNPDAEALFARMTVQPSEAERYIYSDAIDALQLAGIWDQLDAIYSYGVHDEQAALLNWKGATFDCTNNGAHWKQYAGYVGDNGTTTGYLDTGLNPAVDVVNYGLSDATIGFALDLVEYDNGKKPIGVATAAQDSQISMGDTTTVTKINTNGLTIHPNVSRDVVCISTRRDASNIYSYINKDEFIGTTGTGAIPNGNFYVCAVNNTAIVSDDDHTKNNVSFAFIGAQLSQAQSEVLTDIINTFNEAIRPVDVSALYLFDRMNVQPTEAQKVIYNTAISDLRSAGIWTKLDVLCGLGVHDPQAGRRNWRSDDYNAQNVGAAFDDYFGYNGGGVNGYLTTQYIPSTDGKFYTLTEASMGFFCDSNLSDNEDYMGVDDAAGGRVSELRLTGTSCNHYLNGGFASTTISARNTSFISSRVDLNNRDFYEGKTKTSYSSFANGVPTNTVFVLTANNAGVPSGSTDANINCYFMGGYLTTTEVEDLIDIINQFNTDYRATEPGAAVTADSDTVTADSDSVDASGGTI